MFNFYIVLDMINALVLSAKDAQRAMVIATRTQATSPAELMVAGAKAALIVELKKRMQSSIVEFYFYKKNGELTRRFGTTMGTLVQHHINGNGISRDSVNTVAFFDVEAGSWKSFRYESLVKVC